MPDYHELNFNLGTVSPICNHKRDEAVNPADDPVLRDLQYDIDLYPRQVSEKEVWPPFLNSDGGSCRDRTYDPRIKSPLLYQLS